MGSNPGLPETFFHLASLTNPAAEQSVRWICGIRRDLWAFFPDKSARTGWLQIYNAFPAESRPAHLANALRPKLKFASIIGSYGWSSKAIEQIAELIPNLKVEVLSPVLCKGTPQQGDYEALEKLAATISEKHKENQLI